MLDTITPNLDTGALANAKINAALRTPKDASGVDAAAKDFEAVFLSQMIGHMFSDVSLDPMSEGSGGEDVYKSWMVEQYGKIIADAGGIGIADYVKRELLKAQEMPTAPAQNGQK